MFPKFSMYEQRLPRGLQSPLKQLLELQTGRKQWEERHFKNASARNAEAS